MISEPTFQLRGGLEIWGVLCEQGGSNFPFLLHGQHRHASPADAAKAGGSPTAALLWVLLTGPPLRLAAAHQARCGSPG